MFEEFYNEKFINIRKFDSNQLKIVDAIFENDLVYILQVEPEYLLAVIKSLFEHEDIILNPDHIDMNNYIYSIHGDSTLDFKSLAIMCYQPLCYIEELMVGTLKIEYLVFAVLAGREDVVSSIRHLTFYSNYYTNGSVLHFFARHRRLDLYTQFQANSNILRADKYNKIAFEYFEFSQILELLEGGYLDNVLRDSEALHHLFKIIIANNDLKALDIVMSMLSSKSDLHSKTINYQLLMAIAKCDKAEVANRFLTMTDISQLGGSQPYGIYHIALKKNNYRITELILTHFPKVLDDAHSIPMRGDIVNLHLRHIESSNRRQVTALKRNLFYNCYDAVTSKKVIDKINESHSNNVIVIESYYDFSTSILRSNNTSYIEYLHSSNQKQIKRAKYWIKRGLIWYLQNSNVSTQALVNLLASEIIIKAMGSDHEIANCLLHNGMYKEFQIYMDTIQSCFPIKYKCLLKRILHDSVQQGLNRVEAVLERNPQITPSIFRTVRNHALNPDEISLALKKKMIKTYISNCESQNSNPTHCKLFRKLRQSRGFTKQKKLAYAKQVLAYLEGKSGAPDNQKKISKTGELGKIMRHIRR